MNPVLALLNLLTNSELRRFSKFLNSPFFGQTSFYIELFAVLRIYCPRCEEDKILSSKEYANFLKRNNCKSVTPNKWTGMHKRLKSFIAHEQLKENPYLTLTLHSDFFAKHSDYDMFSDSLEIRRTLLSNSSPQIAGQYYKQHSIEEEYYYHPDTEKSKVNATNIRELERSLDDYYYLQKLRIYCEKLIRQKLTTEQYAFHDFSHITNHAKVHLTPRSPLAEIYLRYAEFLQSEFDINEYSRLINLVSAQAPTIAKSELRSIFILLINLTNRARHKSLLTEEHIYALYEKMIEQDVLAIYGRITPVSFYNVVWLKAELLKFGAAYKFITDYKKYLAPQYQELVKAAEATVKFKEKKYQETLQILTDTTFRHPYFLEIVKLLVIKSSFEADIIAGSLRKREKTYEMYLMSFRKFLSPARSPHLSKTKRKEYQNFLTFFKKVKDIYGDSFAEMQVIVEFEEKMKRTERIFGRKWLTEKITDYKRLQKEKSGSNVII